MPAVATQMEMRKLNPEVLTSTPQYFKSACMSTCVNVSVCIITEVMEIFQITGAQSNFWVDCQTLQFISSELQTNALTPSISSYQSIAVFHLSLQTFMATSSVFLHMPPWWLALQNMTCTVARERDWLMSSDLPEFWLKNVLHK